MMHDALTGCRRVQDLSESNHVLFAFCKQLQITKQACIMAVMLIVLLDCSISN